MAKKRGRPKKEGERYPSGKLKPAKESDKIAPTLLHRICEEVERGAAHPDLGTALGRLRLQKLITSTQAAAGFKFSEIHGGFGYYAELRRVPKSPSYESGYRSSMTAADAAESDDEETEAEQNAVARFRALPTQQPGFPAAQRAIVERVCVENEMPASHHLPDLRVWLDALAAHFGTVKAGKKKKPQAERKARDNQPKKTTPIIARERDSWIKVIAQLRPDLDEKDSIRAFDVYKALAAREEFRENKRIYRDTATNCYAA